MDDDSGDEDYEESMSMYEEEDEDDIHPTMSFDEDIDDLQSYRNHNNEIMPNDDPNDSTNKNTASFGGDCLR